MKCGEKVR